MRRKNKKYAGKITKHYKEKYAHIILLVSLMLASATIGYISNLPPYEQELTNIEHVKLITEYPEIEIQIREIAKENNFQWEDYLVRLAMCESSMNPEATRDNGRYGVDRGIFQINDYYHPEVSDEVAYDLRLATEWTMWRINNGYQHEWVCNDKI